MLSVIRSMNFLYYGCFCDPEDHLNIRSAHLYIPLFIFIPPFYITES